MSWNPWHLNGEYAGLVPVETAFHVMVNRQIVDEQLVAGIRAQLSSADTIPVFQKIARMLNKLYMIPSFTVYWPDNVTVTKQPGNRCLIDIRLPDNAVLREIMATVYPQFMTMLVEA